MTELTSDYGTIPDCAATDYQRDGFYIAHSVIEEKLVTRAAERMDRVLAGEYETGTPPRKRLWNPGDDPNQLRKINDPHLADNAIYELVSSPALGRWAAAILGAKKVQVWTTQLLYKPSGGTQTGNVGWHQDRDYWPYWQQEDGLFTAWVALSDVGDASGPMQFVPGSHTWGFLDQGNFFEADRDLGQANIKVPPGETWTEVSALLPPGGASFHHCLTFHGSGPNVSNEPRKSIAIHLRTEKVKPVPGSDHYYVSHLDDSLRCPVIYEA